MTKSVVLSSIDEMRTRVLELRSQGKSVGVIPTMGALHEGHLSLVDASRRECDIHVATIFVNPTQFGAGEDLDRYPRTLESDVEMLKQRGVDFVFVPAIETMYPLGFSTFVQPPIVALRFEGAHRGEHFRGVATVVLKLFQIVPANVAFFGEKDFQQCLVIKHMVRDLNLGIDIRPCAIVREPDGLAMSSRNRYLGPTERERALGLSRSLNIAEASVSEGIDDPIKLAEQMREVLMDHRVDSIDYAEVVDAETLEPLISVDRPAVAIIAAHVGATRLIDNRRLTG